jgi:peptide/nickel transport system ATP-binding protein
MDQLLRINDLQLVNEKSKELILDHISFSVEKQKITGIVGESGSGKSMTALSLLRLLPNALKIASGEAVFHFEGADTDLFKIRESQISKIRGKEITMIFQEPMTSLNPTMRCGLQIAESLRYHLGEKEKIARPRIIDLFDQTGLPDPERIYSSYPHQLSGGQRQRVMIAMALSTNPSLVIADEPTTALDVSVQKSIISLLQKLQKEHKLTIIFISHDLRLLGEIADHIVVMRKGRIVEEGPKKTLFVNPAAAYTRGLLECQPPLDHRPYRLLTVEDFENSIEGSVPESGKNDARIYSPKPHPRGADTQTHGSKVPVEEYPESSGVARGKRKEDPFLLSIKDLTVIYSGNRKLFGRATSATRAVNGVFLNLRKGETLGLVGESGCGKTTLGKTILLLTENYSGDIIFKGRSLASMDKKQKKKFRKEVQVVFQDPYSSLNPRMKTGTVLNEARKLHFPGETKEERGKMIQHLIEKTGLEIRDLDKYPHEFSGGQRQRIGIARALVTEPELIVLDESVSALDVSVQAQILNLLNDLKSEFKLSYIFISHDLAVVKYMSDRIIVMKDGEFEEMGNADEVYRHPVSDYTKKLINAVPGYQNSSGSV